MANQNFTHQEEIEICMLYNSPLLVKEIAEQFECSEAAIKRVLEKHPTKTLYPKHRVLCRCGEDVFPDMRDAVLSKLPRDPEFHDIFKLPTGGEVILAVPAWNDFEKQFCETLTPEQENQLEDEEDRLIEEQGDCCLICGRSEMDDLPEGDALNPYRDFLTDKIRGMLCISCLDFLDTIKRDPEIAQKLVEFLKG